MIGTDEKGTASSQDRSNQPKRAGGNSINFGIESHDQTKGSKIKQGGAGDKTTGNNKQWGFEFNKGGNAAQGKTEKHDNAKSNGKSRDIPNNIEIAERKESSGNSSNGSHEKPARGSKKVGEERRFDK